MPDVISTQVPLWGVFTHLVCIVAGWYGHMKYGKQGQALANQVTSAVSDAEKKL